MPVLIPIAIALISAAYTAYTTKQAQAESKKKSREAAALRTVGGEVKSNTRSTTEPIKVIYGKHRVGGNIAYMTTTGHKHQNLYMAITHSEGPIEGIVLDNYSQPYIWFDGTRSTASKYTGLHFYELLTGTASQTCSTLLSGNTEFNDNMRNTAWTAWKLIHSQDVWQSIPEIQCLIKGRLLYDFRTTTTAWSDNPVLALYDYLTNERYGCGISAALLDLTTFEAAADYCESKDFTINMCVNLGGKSVWNTVDDILKLFRGNITYWDGKYYLNFRDLNEEASVFTIEDEHILLDESGKAQISLSDPGYYNIPKAIRVSFCNAENDNYTDDSFIVGNEQGLIEDLELAGCTDREMAGILATYELERAQLTRTVSGRFRDDLISIEPGNIVTLNSSALGISDQLMRVIGTTYSNTGFIDLAMQYEDTTLYDGVYNISAEGIYKCDLPDPSIVALIEDAAVTETTYVERLRTRSRLDITFTVPAIEIWFKQVEVWVAVDTGSHTAPYTHQFNTVGSFSIDPVEEGSTYYIKLRTENIWGVKQSLSDCIILQIAVQGKLNTAPASLLYLQAIPGDGGISLRSDKLDSSDIEVYEFRYGTQWTGAVLLSAKRAPYEDLGLVKPGIHTFWANTKGTNGLYGDDPVTADVSTHVPKGWSAYTTFTDDFTDGSATFLNTEHYSYNSADWLKCSHSITLSGGYTSIEFDTATAAATYYVYVDTETTTLGVGTTWNSVLSNETLTWNDIDAENRSWKDIFEVEEAPKLYIRVFYKEEAAHDWSYIESAQVLAGVVKARYFKVEIKIEDPSAATNLLVKEYTLRLYS